MFGRYALDTAAEVRAILGDVLGLQERGASLADDAQLLGAVPELDSMAVVAVITTLEEHFGFVIDDDDIDGETFSTLKSLVEFVNRKLAA